MKKSISIFLCFLLLLLNVGIVSAKSDETRKITTKDGRIVNITIKASVDQEIPYSDLVELANENAAGDNIIIYAVGTIDALKPSTDKGTFVPKPNNIPIAESLPQGLNNLDSTMLGITTATPIITWYTKKDVFESDRFMASCAKGETKTLSYSITEKLSLEIKGDLHIGNGGLKNEISFTMTKGQTLHGPSETSSYNCREFRCKFYENKGRWAQTLFINGIPFYLDGTFTEPSYYYSYSIDRII